MHCNMDTAKNGRVTGAKPLGIRGAGVGGDRGSCALYGPLRA